MLANVLLQISQEDKLPGHIVSSIRAVGILIVSHSNEAIVSERVL